MDKTFREDTITEKYYLPVLFTEEERRRYAEWGIKKEKALLPFAVITIMLDLLVFLGTLAYFLMVREKEPFFSAYIAAWGGSVTKVAYGVAIVLTILIVKPLDLILDQIFKKPQDPKQLCLMPTVQGVCYTICQNKNTLLEGILAWDDWKRAISVEKNEICIENLVLQIGANTIESIYPKEKQNRWMDRPEEKIRNSVHVGTIAKNFEGYLASLKEQKREEAWARQNAVK